MQPHHCWSLSSPDVREAEPATSRAAAAVLIKQISVIVGCRIRPRRPRRRLPRGPSAALLSGGGNEGNRSLASVLPHRENRISSIN
ncbi:hypothetical protein E2562_030247 [Oryza meyeriana var. granulata]|uniref:Uncharacterized protein n=1 Tax=Oryza meyeriana var. granulata TaxID=110450 RepID=A0A6G1D938_9ORYZ|nr:hypothetical protein E2562_030247 [Oryza meyeriana var. granulata]